MVPFLYLSVYIYIKNYLHDLRKNIHVQVLLKKLSLKGRCNEIT